MFTYTSLFLVSLLVAIIARVVYKSISNASGSVYNTKLPNAELVHLETAVKNKAVVDETVDTHYPTDLKKRGTYAYLNDNQKAVDALKVAEDSLGEWAHGNDVINVDQVLANAEGNHCSLYEADNAEVVAVATPNVAPAPPKEKVKTGGGTYNVTGKVAADNVSLDANGKPWGW